MSGAYSLWADYRGHQEIRQAFSRAISRRRLTQSYAFVGPEGIGKQGFARRLAQCLLCQSRLYDTLEACGECIHCRPFRAGTHPDFIQVDRDPGKRELTVAKFVGDREQRGKAGLCYELSIRPVDGSRKIAIINEADTMNEEAANALLKTLEEPPENSMLILIAKSATSLLPTIRSRCQFVRFQPLSDADVTDFLISQDVACDSAEIQGLVELAGGSLSAALQLSRQEFRNLRKDWLTELAKPNWAGIPVARMLTERLDKLANDSYEQRSLVNWLILSAADFFRDLLRASYTGKSATDREFDATFWTNRLQQHRDDAVDEIEQILARCQLAVKQLDQNVALGLCLESLCYDLAAIGRSERS